MDILTAIDEKYQTTHQEIAKFVYPSHSDYERWLVNLRSEQAETEVLKAPDAAFIFQNARILRLKALVQNVTGYEYGQYGSGDAAATEMSVWSNVVATAIPTMNALCATAP